jgi:hypothetical protein
MDPAQMTSFWQGTAWSGGMSTKGHGENSGPKQRRVANAITTSGPGISVEADPEMAKSPQN